LINILTSLAMQLYSLEKKKSQICHNIICTDNGSMQW